jgi:hypothetical protein
MGWRRLRGVRRPLYAVEVCGDCDGHGGPDPPRCRGELQSPGRRLRRADGRGEPRRRCGVQHGPAGGLRRGDGHLHRRRGGVRPQPGPSPRCARGDWTRTATATWTAPISTACPPVPTPTTTATPCAAAAASSRRGRAAATATTPGGGAPGCDGDVQRPGRQLRRGDRRGEPGGGDFCLSGQLGACALGHTCALVGSWSACPTPRLFRRSATGGSTRTATATWTPRTSTASRLSGRGRRRLRRAAARLQLPAGKSCGDCDDARARVHPGAAESCNDRDDDCNGETDEGNPAAGLLQHRAARRLRGGPRTCVERIPRLCPRPGTLGGGLHGGLDEDCDGDVDGADLDCVPDCPGRGRRRLLRMRASCQLPAGKSCGDCDDTRAACTRRRGELQQPRRRLRRADATRGSRRRSVLQHGTAGQSARRGPRPASREASSACATRRRRPRSAREARRGLRRRRGHRRSRLRPRLPGPGWATGSRVQWRLPAPAGKTCGDCDDRRRRAPGRAEACNDRDDDCDGQTDEGNPGGGACLQHRAAGRLRRGDAHLRERALTCVRDQALGGDLHGRPRRGLRRRRGRRRPDCVPTVPDADGDGYAVCGGGCQLPRGKTCGDCDDTRVGCAPGAAEPATTGTTTATVRPTREPRRRGQPAAPGSRASAPRDAHLRDGIPDLRARPGPRPRSARAASTRTATATWTPPTSTASPTVPTPMATATPCCGGCQVPAGKSCGDCDDTPAGVHPGAAETLQRPGRRLRRPDRRGNPGGGAACSTGQQGVCAAGTRTCVSGALTCVRDQAPRAEVCTAASTRTATATWTRRPRLRPRLSRRRRRRLRRVRLPAASSRREDLRRLRRHAGGVHPGATETCNDRDDDCDGQTDDGNPAAGPPAARASRASAPRDAHLRERALTCVRDQGPRPRSARAASTRTATATWMPRPRTARRCAPTAMATAT